MIKHDKGRNHVKPQRASKDLESKLMKISWDKSETEVGITCHNHSIYSNIVKIGVTKLTLKSS